MAVKIGASSITAAYLGTTRVRHIYLGKSLVFSDMVNLTISIGTGVSYVSVFWTRVDGAVFSKTCYSTTTIPIEYGSKVTMSAVAAIGYSMNSYTSGIDALTSARGYSYTATAQTYFTDVNLNYNSTQYGNSYGDKIGSFFYSRNNSSWYGPYSNEPWTENFAYGSYLYLRTVTAAPGFTLSSVRYNGATITASGGVYKIQIAAGSYAVDINFTSRTSTSSASFNHAKSITTNSLTRNAFNVNFNFNINVDECAAGAVIGTIPAQYRPATTKTYTTTWLTQTGSATNTNTATITISPSGAITSNLESTGSGSSSGGGKWGSYMISWKTTMVISGSYSVI